MNRLLAVGLLGLIALARCGGPEPKPPPVLNLTITGGSDQNPDGLGRPSPVAVRVYQLSGTAKFEQSDIFALKDREAQTLGSESQGSQEFLIAPGEKKAVTINLKPLVAAIGVAVLYRDIDNARWRAVQPANANGPTALAATSNKLTLVLKPDSPPPAPGLMSKIKGMVGGEDSAAGKAVDTAKDAASSEAKSAASDALKAKLFPGAKASSSGGSTSGASVPGLK
jgi:type VI secretion system protein VasD